MIALSKGYKKLRFIRVWTSICHCEHASFIKFQLRMNLVLERHPRSWLSTCSRPCRVSALNHKPRNQPMEDGSIVIIVQTQLNEITAGQRCFTAPKFEFEFALACVQNNLSSCSWLVLIFMWVHYNIILIIWNQGVSLISIKFDSKNATPYLYAPQAMKSGQLARSSLQL